MTSSPHTPERPVAAHPDVLFVCVRNAGRSRMAEALFTRAARGRWSAASAGTQPADRPHREVVETLRELGAELDPRPGRLLTPELVEAAGRVISMGCSIQDACPATTTPLEDWALDDPEGLSAADVRRIRDEVAARVRRLVSELEARDAEGLRPGGSSTAARPAPP